METPFNLAETFLKHVRVRVAAPDELVEFERLLHRAWESGREPWPQLALPAGDFVSHLAQRLPENASGRRLEQVLGELVISDLYLACACVHEVPGAIGMLERHYLAKLSALRASLNLSNAMLDEVCQKVRIQLLVGLTDAGPQLAHYRGEGRLLSWIQVMASRMVSKQAAPKRETPDEDVLAAIKDLPMPGSDAELEVIKNRYRDEFNQAVRDAFAVLSDQQRDLLRFHFADRLSTTAMAKLYPVDQSTISRWLKGARQAVYEQTKYLLKERLGLSSNEFKSLLNVIRSQLDLRLSQVLKEDKREED